VAAGVILPAQSTEFDVVNRLGALVAPGAFFATVTAPAANPDGADALEQTPAFAAGAGEW